MLENAHSFVLQNPGFNLRRIFWLAVFMTVVTIGVATFFIVKNFEQYPYEFDINAFILVVKLFIVIIAVWFWSAFGKREFLRVTPEALEVTSHASRLLARADRQEVVNISFTPSSGLAPFALIKLYPTWAIRIAYNNQESWYYQLSYETIPSITSALETAGYAVEPIEAEQIDQYAQQVRQLRYISWLAKAGVILTVASIVYDYLAVR